MLNLRIADLYEGHLEEHRTISKEDLHLTDSPEFNDQIHVTLQIEKNGNQIIISMDVNTTVDFTCDRCTESYQTELYDTGHLLYTADPEMKNQEDDGIYYFSPTEREIDLTEPVRETLLLALPAKRLCKEECKGLCSLCGANLNSEDCNCPTDHPDPRWEKLKDLLK